MCGPIVATKRKTTRGSTRRNTERLEALAREHTEPVIIKRAFKLAALPAVAVTDAPSDHDVPRILARVAARVRLDRALWVGGTAADRERVRQHAARLNRAIEDAANDVDVRWLAIEKFIAYVRSRKPANMADARSRTSLEETAEGAIKYVRRVSVDHADALTRELESVLVAIRQLRAAHPGAAVFALRNALRDAKDRKPATRENKRSDWQTYTNWRDRRHGVPKPDRG